jgi:exosortase
MVAFSAIIVALGGVLFTSPWMAYVAAVLVITAWMLLRLGATYWRSILALTSILWITVPLPLGYDGKLISLLQTKSSVVASLVLDNFGILHLREGNILELTAKRLFVDEACSGIDSLYALMAICLSVVVWFRQPFLVGALSLSLVPVWASMSNIVRLVSIAVGIDRFNIDLSHGTPHTILGLVVFAGAFFVDFCFIQFAGGLNQKLKARSAFAKKPSTQVNGKRSGEIEAIASRSTLSGPRHFEKWLMGAFAIAMIALGGYSVWAIQTKSIHRLPQFDQPTLAKLADRDKLPMQLANTILVDFRVAERNLDSAFGQHSHIWTYKAKAGTFTISTDFPFRGFHALHQCYQSSGWSLESEPREIELKTEPGSTPMESDTVVATELALRKPSGGHAYLLYCLFTLDGKQQTSLAKGIKTFERLQQTILEPVTFQIQVFAETADQLSPESQEQLRKVFIEAIPRLRASFLFLSEQPA